MFPLIQENTNNNHHRNVKEQMLPKKHTSQEVLKIKLC